LPRGFGRNRLQSDSRRGWRDAAHRLVD
jgi:hypothetical protein